MCAHRGGDHVTFFVTPLPFHFDRKAATTYNQIFQQLLQFMYSNLKTKFAYEPATGNITSLVRQGRFDAGDIIDTKTWHGHVYVEADKQQIQAHRYAWWLNHGDIPEGMVIDHIDGCPWNNQLSNLRLATSSQNNFNRQRVRSDAKDHGLTVYPGVKYDPQYDNWVVKHGRDPKTGTNTQRRMPSLLEAMCLKKRLQAGGDMPERIEKGSEYRKFLESNNV